MAKCINSDESEKQKAETATSCDTIQINFTQNYKIYS